MSGKHQAVDKKFTESLASRRRLRTVVEDHNVTEGDTHEEGPVVLKLHRNPTSRSRRSAAPDDAPSSLERPDLRVGSLLDHPDLRRAMGLGEPEQATVHELRPAHESPRFDRRRLLEQATA